MRLVWLPFLAVVFAVVPMAAQQTTEEQSTRPRVSRSSGGVTVIRGSTSQSRSAAELEAAPASEAAEAAPEAQSETPQPQQPARRVVRSSSYRYDANGRRVREATAVESDRKGEEGSSAATLSNLNGRRVPYIRSEQKVVAKTASGGVREQRTQRYDVAGRPTQQEVVRIEEQRLPDGTVVTTSTKYRENLNGRMEAVERETIRTKESGATTTTTTVVERPAVNGGFGPIKRVESVERKQGETRATVETKTMLGAGSGRLQLASREETVMTKSGSVATTETTKYERDAATGDLRESERSVGKLVEKADGSSTETIETYGKETASGARNLNATRMELQEVVERTTSVGSDGTVRERTRVRSRDVADPSEMGPAQVVEKVTRPSADGETVRTDTYERGVNGRMRPAGSTIEDRRK